MGGRRGRVASHPERGEDVKAEDMTENLLGNVGWFWEVKMAGSSHEGTCGPGLRSLVLTL